MGEAIVSIVAERLNDLLKEEPQFLGVGSVGDEIQQVVTKLMWINTFLPDAYSRIYEPRIRILLAEVRDVAYDAEHVVESFIVKAAASGKTTPNTIKFIKKLKDIQTKMSVRSNRFNDYNIRSTLQSPESSNSSYQTPAELKRFYSKKPLEPEIYVGFEEDVHLLVGHLVNESDDSQKIYNHPTIKSHFAGLAWVSISQKWQTNNVLHRIVRCLAANGSKTKESESRSETEWVEQDEPGVYITLTSLPGGVKDLKRIRFSRKRFSEKQAEQWWAENRGRVYEKYNVRMVDKSSVGIGSEDFT